MGEARLEDRLRDLSGLLDQINCGLFGTDRDGDLFFVNERLREWLGYEMAELVGRPSTDLVPEELRDVIEAESLAAQRGDVRARLIVVQRKNSTTFPAIVLPQPFYTEGGRFTGALIVVIELATVETAKPVGPGAARDVRGELIRIALQIQSLSLAAAGAVVRVPLEHPSFAELSRREGEVLSELLAGHRVPAISSKLFISPHTVRNHLKSIFGKVGVTSQSELIERARELAEETPES